MLMMKKFFIKSYEMPDLTAFVYSDSASTKTCKSGYDLCTCKTHKFRRKDYVNKSTLRP